MTVTGDSTHHLPRENSSTRTPHPPLHPRPPVDNKFSIKGHAATYSPESSAKTKALLTPLIESRSPTHSSLLGGMAVQSDYVSQRDTRKIGVNNIDSRARKLVEFVVKEAIKNLLLISNIPVELTDNVIYKIKNEHVPELIKTLNTCQGLISSSKSQRSSQQSFNQKSVLPISHKSDLRQYCHNAISTAITVLISSGSTKLKNNDEILKEVISKRIHKVIQALKGCIHELSNRTFSNLLIARRTANANGKIGGNGITTNSVMGDQAKATSHAALTNLSIRRIFSENEGSSTEAVAIEPSMRQRRNSQSSSPLSSLYLSPSSGEEITDPHPPSDALNRTSSQSSLATSRVSLLSHPAKEGTNLQPTTSTSLSEMRVIKLPRIARGTQVQKEELPSTEVPSRSQPTQPRQGSQGASVVYFPVTRSFSNVSSLYVAGGNEYPDTLEKVQKFLSQGYSLSLIREVINKYLHEYRGLQRQNIDNEKEKKALLKRYRFSELRECCWALTKWSPDDDKMALDWESALISCFENSPLNEITNELLNLYLNKIVIEFGSISHSLKINRLRLLTIISEAWSLYCFTPRNTKLVVNKVLLDRITKTLDDCANMKFEVVLNSTIAQEAIKIFSPTRPINLWVQPINDLVETILRTVHRNEGNDFSLKEAWEKAEKISLGYSYPHQLWYLKLCAIRKARYHIYPHADKLRLLQLCLTEHIITVNNWYFVGEIFQMMGQLALETDSLRLKFDILMGKKWFVNATQTRTLPGFYHFREPTVSIMRTQLQQGNFIKEHLSQMVMSYARRITQFFPLCPINLNNIFKERQATNRQNNRDKVHNEADQLIEANLIEERALEFRESLPESPKATSHT